MNRLLERLIEEDDADFGPLPADDLVDLLSPGDDESDDLYVDALDGTPVPLEAVEDVIDEAIENEPTEPVKKRWGHNLGMTKADRPKLSNRLPREKGAIVAIVEDPRTYFERCWDFLGDRVANKRVYYTLDGKPCNATDIIAEVERVCGILVASGYFRKSRN